MAENENDAGGFLSYIQKRFFASSIVTSEGVVLYGFDALLHTYCDPKNDDQKKFRLPGCTLSEIDGMPVVPALEWIAGSVPNQLQRFWEFLNSSYSAFAVSTYIPLIFLLSSHFFVSLPLMVLEFVDFKPIKKYKIQKHRYNDAAMFKKCVRSILFYYIGVILPVDAVSFPIFKAIGFRLAGPFPRWYFILAQLAFCLVSEDFAHYWAHRALHNTFLSKHIHSVHHEYAAPYGLAASYAHPLEIIALGICTFSGAMILRTHMFVFLVWAHIRQYAAIETHCGYEFPFSPRRWFPLWGGALYHDFHHSHRQGIFASNFIVWDWVFGTDVWFRDYYRKKAEKDAKVLSASRNTPGGNEEAQAKKAN